MNDEPDVKQAGSSAQSASTGIPAYPSGSVNKEVEPGSVSEFLKPSTPELELPEEHVDGNVLELWKEVKQKLENYVNYPRAKATGRQ